MGSQDFKSNQVVTSSFHPTPWCPRMPCGELYEAILFHPSRQGLVRIWRGAIINSHPCPAITRGFLAQVPVRLNGESGLLSPPAGNSNKANCNTLNLFSFRVGTSQGCLLSPVLLNLVLQTLAITVRHGMQIKGI